MNERIKEFIEQSGAGDVTPPGFHKYLAKFADMIVRDCASVCDDIAEMAEITNTGEVARKTKATAINCSNFIKNRFGIE
jgi:hypothetical protein